MVLFATQVKKQVQKYSRLVWVELKMDLKMVLFYFVEVIVPDSLCLNTEPIDYLVTEIE